MNAVPLSVIQLPDGTLVSSDGVILWYSESRFVEEICNGNSCFICGVSPTDSTFNNEHVLPNWVLKKFGLHDEQLNLPNLTGIKYGQYKIPCCEQCNSDLGSNYEEPIREALSGGFETLTPFLKDGGAALIYCWLNLVYLKVHLKGHDLKFHRDQRLGDERISDLYSLKGLHHSHSVARAHHTGALLDFDAIGSVVILEAATEPPNLEFDFGCLATASTIMIKLGDVCLFAVLNDAKAAAIKLKSILSKMTGPISSKQLREIHAHLSYININLRNRPTFRSEINDEGEFRITVDHEGKIQLKDHDSALLQELLSLFHRDDNSVKS